MRVILNDWLNWLCSMFRRVFGFKSSNQSRQPRMTRRRRLGVECLEPRRQLTVNAYDTTELVLHDQTLQAYVSGYDDTGATTTFSSSTAPTHVRWR